MSVEATETPEPPFEAQRASALPVSVAPVNLGSESQAAWDAFATRCQASIRSAYAHLRSLPLRRLFLTRPLTYRVMLGSPGHQTAIGYFTLLRGRHHTEFYDGVCMLPEHAGRWGDAMKGALAVAGPGRFSYGSNWSTEPSREAELRDIPGTTLHSVRNILVQGVEFANWPTWELYYRAISENVRRNHKRAASTYPDLALITTDGIAAIKLVPQLVRMRRDMYQAKGVSFNPGKTAVGYTGRFLACPEQASITMAMTSGQCLAIQNTAEFGSTHYYLEGAAAAESNGAAWLLQIDKLKDMYARHPRGRFLLGYTDLPLDEQDGQGLLRSRRSLRCTDWPTSMLQFSWSRG